MSDSIFYCVNCTTSQLCHTERKCMRQAHGSPAPICSGGLTNEAFTKFYQHVKDPNNGWQPIETAPKDGTEILIWNGSVVQAAWGCNGDGDYNNLRWEPSFVGSLWQDNITHWMPLPEPPTENGES